MPELPEVETICRGLAKPLAGKTFMKVAQHRKDLRFPLPDAFAGRVEGRTVLRIRRRAKYILLDLDDAQTLVLHLGMSGRITVNPSTADRHDHLVFDMQDGTRAVFNDPRRFGMADLCATAALERHRLFAHLGPEPLEKSFTPRYLAAKLAGRKTDIKTALMDQKTVVGVGNIYASESLWLAGIHPLRPAGKLSTREVSTLVTSVRKTLRKAIMAGGSSLRDYVQADGKLGYFQHQWAVYGKEGEKCPACADTCRIERIVQGGRSTFFCKKRQT